MLALVGIDAVHLKSFPHQLSGGMRQRVMIAMALLFSPELILMDEPTSALDVVAQRSLMVQVKELQQQLGFAIIFVTHDMSLVSHFSDRLAVMYAGQVVELGRHAYVFDDPLHPYTRGLLDAFPSVYGPKVRLEGIPGAPPNLAELPAGCRFNPRCPKVMRAVLRVAARALTRSEASSSGASCTKQRGGQSCLRRRAPAERRRTGPARDQGTDPPLSHRGPCTVASCTRSTRSTSSSPNARSSPLVGESGSGKSTVARLLAMVYRPTAVRSCSGDDRSSRSAGGTTCLRTAARSRWSSRTRSAP